MKLLRNTAFFLFLICLLGCYQFDRKELDNLHGELKVIGHGGSGFASLIPFNPYPANSLISILSALEEGADGVEVDVHFTADQNFLIYHDNRLESKTTLTGCPSDYSLSELSQLHYQLGFPFDLIQDEALISLKELIQQLNLKHPQKELHLDLRNYSDCLSLDENEKRELDYIRSLRDSLISWKVDLNKITVITYSWRILGWLKENKFPGKLSLELADRKNAPIKWALENQITSLTIKPNLLDPAYSDSLHQLGFELITFGAKSKSGNLDLLKKNPDLIQTDNVRALRELLSD